MSDRDTDAPIVVTGGSGFVASWIIRSLLEEHHTVRATLRNPHASQGLEHLHELAAQYPGKLSLHQADLLKPGSYQQVLQGAQLVYHTASPFLVDHITDPYHQLVQPALEGTRNVLQSVNRTPSVRKVVLTSSVVAIVGDYADMAGKGCLDEHDWNTTSTLVHQPYSYSKTCAEQAAWKIAQSQDRWEMVVMNPALVLGPSLTRFTHSGSMSIMAHFADMSMALGAPALKVPLIDVRDLASAHLRAAQAPSGRYIICSGVTSLLGISQILQHHFGPHLSFPQQELPKSLLRALAPLTGMTREYIDRNVGYPLAFDTSRMTHQLGITPRPLYQSVIDHFSWMLDSGTIHWSPVDTAWQSLRTGPLTHISHTLTDFSSDWKPLWTTLTTRLPRPWSGK